ncbi:MAG: hypothetical protein ACRETU_00870 [Steroidobacterales bacterium]
MSSQAGPGTATAVISKYALLIRWVVTLHLMALAAQLATAIFVVGGEASALVPHMKNAWAVATLGVAQALLVVTVRVPETKLRIAHRVMAVAIVAGEAMQIHFGTTLSLAVHVTTAMALWGFAVAIAIKVWAPPWKLKD